MTSSSPSAHPLTDTQLVLLSRASQRADGRVVPPDHLRGGVLRRVMASLIGKGLVQPATFPADVGASKPDDDHAGTCPVISSAGLAALGIADDANAGALIVSTKTPADAASDDEVPAGAVERPATVLAASDGHPPEVDPDATCSSSPALPDAERSRSQVLQDATRSPRAGSKQAQVLELLARPEGSSLDEIMTATGWLPHTTRAVISGLRKRGHGIERLADSEGGSRYRLTSSATPSA